MTDVQTAKTTTVKQIAYDQIVDDGTNIRSELTDIDTLAESIWAAGLLNPITVRKNGDGKFHIIAGFRRHAAIGRLITTKRWDGPVPVLMRTDEDADTSVVAMIVENLQRVDVNPVDEAFGIQRLVVEHSFSIADVAVNIGRSEDVVKDRLAICQLTDKALDAVRQRKITLEAAVALSKAGEKLQNKLVGGLGTDSLSYNNTADYIKRMIRDDQRRAARKLIVDALKELDIPVKQGIEYSMKRDVELENATPAKVASWVVANGITATDQITVSDGTYGDKGYTVTRWLARAETPSTAESKTYVADRAEEVFGGWGDELDPTITEWYDTCAAISETIENSRGERNAVVNGLRASFIHDAGKADVAATAIRSLAQQSLYSVRNGLSTESERSFFLTALGITMEQVTPAPVEGDPILPAPTEKSLWACYCANTKVMVRAAALTMCGRYGSGPMEGLFQETIVDNGSVPPLPEFPPMPQILAEYVAAAGYEPDLDDMSDLDMLIEGYLVAYSQPEDEQTEESESDDDAEPDTE